MEALDLEAQVTFVFGSQKFLWHVTRIISCQLRGKKLRGPTDDSAAEGE